MIMKITILQRSQFTTLNFPLLRSQKGNSYHFVAFLEECDDIISYVKNYLAVHFTIDYVIELTCYISLSALFKQDQYSSGHLPEQVGLTRFCDIAFQYLPGRIPDKNGLGPVCEHLPVLQSRLPGKGSDDL